MARNVASNEGSKTNEPVQQKLENQDVTVISTVQQNNKWLVLTEHSKIAENITSFIWDIERAKAEGRFNAGIPQVVHSQMDSFGHGITVKNEEVGIQHFKELEDELFPHQRRNQSSSSLATEPGDGSGQTSMLNSEVLVAYPTKTCNCHCIMLKGVGGGASDSTS